MSNHLSSELSPYLLQHKDNPVDWYPWCDEAFEQAKDLDRPIFLSIGYATCHWCHVMEHESFEDKEVASLMNNTFINIKVDREERPDIDHLYMSVCQILTGAGGWPLTIIMTPDKRPFFAGTYFPKQSFPNRPGMLELIPTVGNAWINQRSNILQSTQTIMAGLIEHNQQQHPQSLSSNISEKALRLFEQSFDSQYGGFSNAPKFPMPHQILFLLRYYKRTQNESALSMALTTLDAINHGGIYDHVGFGFHRYSTDSSWKIPHFEKMLYDQALLLSAYALAYEITKKQSYKDTIDNTITYLTRDLQAKTPGFFSAEDADSEGEEGRFYTWSYAELSTILTPQELTLLSNIFEVSKEGNYIDEATHQSTQQIILHCESYDKNVFTGTLIPIYEKLFTYRSQRIRPSLDDKILTDWNGLAIAGLAQASKALQSPKYQRLATECADFILSTLVDTSGHLLHRYKDGSAGISGTAFDYHYLIYGLLNLYQCSMNDTYLNHALRLFKQTQNRFWDKTNQCFYLSDNDDLIIKQHDSYDGALPCVNSVAYYNLLHLSAYLHDPSLYAQAQSLSTYFGSAIERYPLGYTFWLASQESLFAGFPILITTHSLTDSQKNDLSIIENLVIQDLSQAPFLSALDSFQSFTAIAEKQTFYFCHNFKCEKPTTKISELLSYLKKE